MLGAGIGLPYSNNFFSGLDNFSPEDLSDLALWYDFSDLNATGVNADTSHGGVIRGWPNKAASDTTSQYDLVQGTNGLRPTVDLSTMYRPSALFDNSDDLLALANTYATTDETFSFVVVFQSAIDDADVFIAGDDNLNFIEIIGSAGTSIKTRFVGNTVGSNNNAVTVKIDGTESTGTNGDINYTLTSGYEILIVNRAANNEIKFYNKTGQIMATGTSDSTDSDTNFKVGGIGGRQAGNTLKGNIGEMGLYNAKLGDSGTGTDHVEMLAKYLSEKWKVV